MKTVIFVIFLSPLLSQDRSTISRSVKERTGAELRANAAPDAFKTPSAPPGMVLSDQLTEDDAVAIALWNSSSLEAALKNLGVAKADLVEAGLLRNPNFNVLFPLAGKPFEFVLQWPVETFWQRPKRREVARSNFQQVSESLVQSGLETARDARLAYADLALAQRRAAVALEAAGLRGRIAELTERRLAAGDISEFDANLSRIEARSMDDTARRFMRDADAASEKLRMTIGLRGTVNPLRAALTPVDTRPPGEVPEMLALAMESRPDLRAAELAIETAVRQARWERSRVWTLVAPLLSVKETGSPTRTRWGPGLQADLPVLNRNSGMIARAGAEAERAAMLYLVARDRVETQVRGARVDLLQALESLERLRGELRPMIQKNIQLAETSYREGESSFLTVLEANRQVYDIDLREAEATAAVQRARANLEFGIGRKQ
jgi:cobalt-zinc-cadmium efflux system outer membrane protein